MERIPARLDTLSNMLASAPRPVHLIGEGIPYHASALPDAAAEVLLTPETSWRPRAAIVARLGSEMSRQGQFADAMSLSPIYIRRPEAEEKFEERAKRSRN